MEKRMSDTEREKLKKPKIFNVKEGRFCIRRSKVLRG